ncbi:MAG TPA: MOSC domain-containing protein [Kineosporiaceae bacterium]
MTAVCVVRALIPGPKEAGRTAIDKRPITGPVEVGPLGLAGDQVCDIEHHGGAEQAVYAYADEDADWWAEHLQREIPPGLFGENLRTAGVDVTNAVIGERWRVGEVLFEVTAPRIPCVTFTARMDEPRWAKRFSEHGAPGAYLAVLEPGAVRAGDSITLERRPAHGVTIADTFLRADAEVMRRLLGADGHDGFALTPRLRRWAEHEVSRSA